MKPEERQKEIRKQNQSKKIRKGDKVVVIAGDDRGKTGVVQKRVLNRLIVQGINIQKKCIKPTQNAPKGRIVEMETPIDVSNVKLWVSDDQGDHAVKLKVRTNEDGQRDYVYRNGDKEVVYRSVKKPK